MRLSENFPYDYYEMMDIAWQLLNLFETADQQLSTETIRIDPQTREVSLFNGQPDMYTAAFYKGGRPRAALAYLLLQLMTEHDPLAEEEVDEESIVQILQSEDTVFLDSDVSGIEWGSAHREHLRQCILDLSYRDDATSSAAMNIFRGLFVSIPCTYTLSCTAPDGSAVAEQTVTVTSEESTALWPTSSEPVLTLSDGKEYSFRFEQLPYRPGVHHRAVQAIRCLSFNPMPDPIPEPRPIPQPKPEPIPEPVGGEMCHIIAGIDLGTEKTCVAGIDGEPIQLEDDATSIPSFLFYLNAIDSEIGEAARRKGNVHPQACVTAFKRHIGDSNMINGIIAKDGTRIRHTGMDAGARFLSAIRQRMEEDRLFLEKVVITVPADFNAVKRTETIRAALNAGFQEEDVRLLEEPTAAAFYYGCQHMPGLTATYDLGGGTFDFCLLECTPDGSEIRGKGGDLHLGGTDFTREIMKLFMLKAEHDGIDLPPERDKLTDRDVALFYYQLRNAAEQAKIRLSLDDQVDISVSYPKMSLSMHYEITRQEFEAALQPYLARIRTVVSDVLQRAGYTAAQIDRVVIIGGSTLIPCVEDQIRRELFVGCSQFLDADRISPVARGAAVFARSIWDTQNNHSAGPEPGPTPVEPEILPENRTPHDLGVVNSYQEFSCIIPAGTEYSRQGCQGDTRFNFTADSGKHLTIRLCTRQAGVNTVRASLFAANNPIKTVGKLHFPNLPQSGMLHRVLRVILTMNRDGVLSAEAQILAGERVELNTVAEIESY